MFPLHRLSQSRLVKVLIYLLIQLDPIDQNLPLSRKKRVLIETKFKPTSSGHCCTRWV
jgi:hypothetical protein